MKMTRMKRNLIDLQTDNPKMALRELKVEEIQEQEPVKSRWSSQSAK